MKKLLLLLASIMSICIARAQEEDGPTFETLSVPDSASVELAQQTKGKDFFLPLQGKRHVHIYPTLDMCTSLFLHPYYRYLILTVFPVGLATSFASSIV